MRKIRTFKTVILLFSAGTFCFHACKELPPAEAFSPSNTRLHVVWSKPFYADSSLVDILPPIVTDRCVAWLGRPYNKLTCHIAVFDKTNGNSPPAWKDGAKCESNDMTNHFLIGGNNNDILFCVTRKSLHAFSIPTGQSLWTSVLEGYVVDNFGRPSIVGADILVLSNADIYTTPSVQYIERYHAATGQKTNPFSFDESVNTVQWTVNADNDTLLFFSGGATNAYCYNLTQNGVVWKCNVPNVDYGRWTSFPPIIAENNYVLFQYSEKVSCLDFSTGEIIWEITTNNIEDCPILYVEGKVVVRPRYGNVSCYDVRNGNLLWKNTDLTVLDDPNSKMDVYKGNLYLATKHNALYTSPSYLYCLSLETGSVNWFDPGPDKGVCGNVTIDQHTGYLYCHSDWSVICIDLNKTPKK